jgi:hypothetical protein
MDKPITRPKRKKPSTEKANCDGLSGTLDLNHYYETGELPTDPLERKLFEIMIEKGEI